MPASVMRRAVWTAGIAAVVAAIVILSLPLIASTQIVRNSIAQQVSAWSGYRVRLDDAPQIRVWPSFKATLNDVVLSDWSEDEAVVMEAERVEIALSALAALRGEVVFTRIRLIRPTVHLSAGPGMAALPALPQWGRLPRSVELAREVIAANPTEPDVSSLPSDPFGVIEVVEGRVIDDAPSDEPPIISDLNGTLNWPSLSTQATLAARAVWRGENVELNASAARPLLLAAGGRGAVTASLTADPVTASFEGRMDLSADKTYVDGLLQADTGSLKRFVEWATPGDWPDSMARAATLRSNVSGDAQRLKFTEAELNLDGNQARGAFDIAPLQTQPTIMGTLAFSTLDLGTLLATLAPDPADPNGPMASPFSGAANFDLRLSAATATAGSVSMTDVAATAQVKDGLLSLDISDATAFGGTVQIGVRFDSLDDRSTAELRITAENIDGGAMASTLQLAPILPMPLARGSFSVFLKGQGDEFASILQTADGTISASFGEGTIQGINLQSFREQNDKGAFFPLSDISDGALPIESAELKATLTGGIAWIDKAEARLATDVVTLGGLIPFAGRGLALSGSIKPADPEQEIERPQETFFVGGSWNEPYIAPFLVE